VAAILQTELTNTWEFWRQRQNEVATRLSSISNESDEITLTAITIGGTNNGTLSQTLNDDTRAARFGSLATTNAADQTLNVDIRSMRHTGGSDFQNTETRIEYNVDDGASKRMWISFYNDAAAQTDNTMRFGEGDTTEWARFDNGNFGIGTISPSVKLDVTGAANISGTITGGTLTDGTLTITNGNISGATTITATTFNGAFSGEAATVVNGVYTTDTGTVTNTMLAGSIANSKLLNNSVTIGATTIALGASATTITGLTAITATTFNGALTGTATNATNATNSTNSTNINPLATNADAASHFLLFTLTASGNQRPKTDTGLKYTPSTNTLSAANFIGTTDISLVIRNSSGVLIKGVYGRAYTE
jgi:hypothetical protein